MSNKLYDSNWECEANRRYDFHSFPWDGPDLYDPYFEDAPEGFEGVCSDEFFDFFS